MFLQRLRKADEDAKTMKIKTVKELNKMKRQYLVGSSNAGRSWFSVLICNTPSCTCADYVKNGLRVLCKHILFILKYVFKMHDDEEALKFRYLSEDDVKALFQVYELKGINESFMCDKTVNNNKRDLRRILQSHPLFNQPQIVKAIYKIKRSATCQGRSCKALLSIGSLCLKVEGTLTVPFNKEVAVEQSFYFCPKKYCLKSIWCNVRIPTAIENGGVSDLDKNEVGKEFAISMM